MTPEETHVRKELDRYHVDGRHKDHITDMFLLWCNVHHKNPLDYGYLECTEQVEFKMCTTFRWEPVYAANNKAAAASSKRGKSTV